MNGKGDKNRVKDFDSYRKNWDRIFGKDKKKTDKTKEKDKKDKKQ